ncbi:MAG: cobyrinic acid a,c-diamide synthase [Candidatus Thioglobus sp.]|nr:MAG: cobyrinic acid a,c-diamide synthase [Candidatus Thioglobus sp.]RUM86398.1 MAG: cobyrinic acid a,c-diamide synthase [Candidatus Thioglobus sp.]
MKIATVGKGGSGKTTIAGTLARLLAGDGHKVLAIDGDPNPNLALTLGMARDDADNISYIPPSIMEMKKDADGNLKLSMTCTEEDLIKNYSASAPDNIDLIVMGKPADGSAGSGCMCASHRAVRGVITEMSAYGEFTVTDMEAGLEHLKRGTAANVDTMLVVVEPYYRSLEAGARTASLSAELEIPNIFVVANKVKTEADRVAIDQFCEQHELSIIGYVPLEEQFIEAERQAKAPIDFDPKCAGAKAIYEIALKLAELDIEKRSLQPLPDKANAYARGFSDAKKEASTKK